MAPAPAGAALGVADLIWGRRPVLEALRAGRPRRILLLLDARLDPELEAALRDAWHAGVRVEEVSRRDLDRLASGANHQGIIAEVEPYRYADFADILDAVQARHGAADAGASRNTAALLLVLDHLQDPQNLGSLLRTAESVGVDGVILPRARAAGVTPAVVKASAGATEHLRIALVPNLPRAIQQLQAVGVWCLALDGSADRRPDEVDLTLPTALVVGSEGEGISRLVRERCDAAVALPMGGRIASLNAAVAGSIVLYEAWRQRGWQTRTDRPGDGA